MENRSPSVVAGLIALACLAGSAWAENEPAAEQAADWARRLDKAETLKNESQAINLAADRAYEAKETACFGKFRVNACLDEAQREHTRQTMEARRLEIESKGIKREVKREQLKLKDDRHAAEAEERATHLKARAAATAAEQEQAALDAAAQQAEREKLAREGAKRHAADAQRQQKKRADHEARLARQREKAARRAGDDAEH